MFTDNYLSCTNDGVFTTVQKQILDELNNNRYVICDAPKHITWALGAIPKPEKGKVRLNHDYSCPVGRSVNEFACNTKFASQSLQDGLDLIVPSAWFAKLDLAFWVLEVRAR